MGAGHVMRCIAIGQAWRADGGPVVFVSAGLHETFCRRIEIEGFDLVRSDVVPSSARDAEETLAVAQDKGAKWILIDGYHLDEGYRRRIKAGCCHVAWVHDGGPVPGHAVDVVVQPGPAASGRKAIGLDPTVRYVGGGRFLLVRREIVALRNPGRPTSDRVNRVLVSFGGGDDRGMVAVCARALAQAAPDTHVRVLSTGVPTWSERDLSVLRRVDVIHEPGNVAEHMSWADVAVSGAGGTCWEQALLGLPALLVVMADNQLPNARTAESSGFAKVLGNWSEVTEQGVEDALRPLLRDRVIRQEMRAKGEAMIDGLGAERVVRVMKAESIKVRPAVREDAELLFRWTNDPVVRAQSFSSEPVAWESHCAWLDRMLADADSLIFVGQTDEGEPIGTVKFSREGTEATIGVSIATEARGLGYATPLILRGVREAAGRHGIGLVHAYIKTDNQASVRAFQAAAFEHVEPTTVGGWPAHHLVWKPSDEEG